MEVISVLFLMINEINVLLLLCIMCNNNIFYNDGTVIFFFFRAFQVQRRREKFSKLQNYNTQNDKHMCIINTALHMFLSFCIL